MAKWYCIPLPVEHTGIHVSVQISRFKILFTNAGFTVFDGIGFRGIVLLHPSKYAMTMFLLNFDCSGVRIVSV